MIDPVVLSLLISSVGVLMTFFSVNYSVTKGMKETSQQTGVIVANIQSIKDSINDLKETTKDTTGRLVEVERRISNVEILVKNDNKRLKKLEDKQG